MNECPVEIQRIQVEDLLGLPLSDAQRPVSRARCFKLMEKWDWNAYDPIVVSVRPDGRRTLLDGQHRAAVIHKKFGNIPVLCKVIKLDESRKEAQVWRTINTWDPTPTTMQILWSEVAAEEPQAREVCDIVSECGFELPKAGSAISAVSVRSPGAVVYVYKKSGPEGLRDTLNLIKEAWGTQKGVASSVLIRGVGFFLRVFQKHRNFNREALATSFQDLDIKTVLRASEAYRSTHGVSLEKAVCAVLQTHYNKSPIGRSKKMFEPA